MATMHSLSRVDLLRDHLHAQDVPTGVHGDAEVREVQVSVDEANQSRSRQVVGGRIQAIRPGSYTVLYREGDLWMSDTPAERFDLYPVVEEVVARQAETILMNGLGLGVLLNAVLRVPHVRDVTVVEIDPSVIALVAPHYAQLAIEQGKALSVIEGDAFSVSVPGPKKFDVVWHDVWRDISLDNLDGITALHRRYGRRSHWQWSWKRGFLHRERDRLKQTGEWYGRSSDG